MSKTITKEGYVYVGPEGGRLEHIAIAEKALGKKLPSRAQVHHVNGTRSDNAKNNLVICPSGKYHKLLHTRSAAFDATGDANKRRCAYCGKYDDAENLYIWERIAHHKSCKAIYDKNRKLK